MKIGTGTKVTIGIIGIIAAGTIGVLISMQLDGTEADKVQIAASTEQGSANAPEKTSGAPTGQTSDKQVVTDKEAKLEEGWNALKEVLDEVAETPDTKTTTRQSRTPQSVTLQSETPKTTSSRTEDSDTSQDRPRREYHESYNTFISVTKKIKETKAERDRIEKEMEWMVAEWNRSVRDPENPTEEERAELGAEVTPLRVEHAELSSDLNSLANELVSEIEAVAPGAIQTESLDTPRGTIDTVSIDYDQIQSELGSSGERIDGYLGEFFAGFEMKSILSAGWSQVTIGE